MELLQYFLFLFFLMPFLYLLCLPKLKLRNKSSIITTGKNNIIAVERLRLPPGRTGFPLIGETMNYYIKIRKGLHFEFVRDRMEKYSPKIFRTSLIGQPMAILCGAEGNKFLFSNESKLVQVWWPSTMDKLFPMSDNKPTNVHSKRLRNVIFPLIHRVDGLREYVGVMDEVMKQHLEKYWQGEDEVIKAGEMAKMYTLALGCHVFLGISDLSVIEQLVEGIDEIESAFLGVPINLPGTALNRGIKASKAMRLKVEAIVRKKKIHLLKQNASNSTTVKDFIARMLLEVDENGEFLKEEDIASYLLGLIEAGYSTLQTTITMLIKILAELPHVYDSVLNEQKEIANSKDPRDRLKWEDFKRMKYSWTVVCEVLRLYSPTIGGFREVITDITYEGYTIPKGWKIHWLLHSTHKNPKYFCDPEKFDPSRFEGDGPVPYTFIPFGGGSRMCPGNEYARLAILTFVHYVVTEFRWEKINPDEKLLYCPVPSLAQGLPIRLYRHTA